MQDNKNLIVAKEKLIQLQTGIIKLLGIPVFIMDIGGNFILEPINTLEACKIIQGSELGAKRCKEEFLKLIEDTKQTKAPSLSLCYAGCYKFAGAIISNDKILGILMGCQVRPAENVSEFKNKFISLTKELGIEYNAGFLDALNGLPVISKVQLEKISGTLTEMANVVINDELELIQLTKEIVNNYTEINLLYEIGEIFSKGLDIEKAGQIILERVLELMEAERASLMLIDKETNELRIVFAKGIPEEIIKNTRIKVGEGISGTVAKEGKPMLVGNIEDNPKIKGLLIGAEQFKTQSFLSAPLICSPLKIENKVIGVVNVTDKKSGQPFVQQDLNLLSAIGTQLAAVIENRRLFTDIRELFITTVRAFSLALDAKDHYTYGHSQRVTECALAIAGELSLSDEERANIELAGLLHDIGKIGISEAILSKPAKLTTEEFNEIKEHPARGAEILGHIKQLSEIIPGVIYHHERFDGFGYPMGLKKHEIPLIARILAVADAFDAMTSKRAYRDALSREEALEEVKRNTGSQFDPVITEAFLRAYLKGNI